MYAGNAQVSFGYRLTPWVKRLLIANVVIFLVTQVNLRFFFEWFAFAPSEVLTKPWGVLTYMFLHGNLMHLLVNMLVLFFFGPPLEQRWGSAEFVKFYLICGLGGVALSFLLAPSAAIVGASAAIYGLMLAFALIWPNAPIYIWGIFPVKAKWLVGFLFVVSIMSAFGGASDGIAHFAHLGGIITGFFYLKSGWRPGAFGTVRPSRARVRKMAIVSRKAPRQEESSRKKPSDAWKPEEDSMLDEVDRILDKISAEGMAALTTEERATLDQVSKRHRSN
jgi:membrane associated rhomboid family serine protease